MARRHGHDKEYRTALVRAHAVPLLSTMAGSSLTLLPVVSSWPALPPFGFLMLIAWRLLRPELWAAWIALPLGLFDELMGGQPVGSAMFLWTATMLTLDFADTRLLWRDFWIDWLLAAGAIIACIAGTILLSGLHRQTDALMIAIPQMLVSLLCFPITMRICVRLDRLRLPT